MVITGNKDAVAPRLYDNAPIVRGVSKRVLIGPKHGAPQFVMRHFTLRQAGTARSTRIRGSTRSTSSPAVVAFASTTTRWTSDPGTSSFVAPMDKHQFVNAGDEPFEFICVVPLAGDDG